MLGVANHVSNYNLTSHYLGLDDFYKIAQHKVKIDIDNIEWDKLNNSHNFLNNAIKERRRIYGVTTGYGPLANTYIDPSESQLLQKNLIYHLCSGVGNSLPPLYCRAVMLARLNSLVKGCSAVNPDAIKLIVEMLNKDIIPVIPERGTVGASGDLTLLAHMALAIIGEGEVFWQDQKRPAAEILKGQGLTPLNLSHKDGLALVNGTSAMTGIAAINAHQAQISFLYSLTLGFVYAELLQGHTEAWHTALGRIRPHPGQNKVLIILNRLAESSSCLVPFSAELPIIPEVLSESKLMKEQPLLQDVYSIRCIPQIYGAISDLLDFHYNVAEIELNSVTDNPVVVPNVGLLHGGNFLGQHISFASDTLDLAIIKMAVCSERRIARITDPVLNKGLPAFMQKKDTGLHFGFMGAQVTATAILAEMRSNATPASIQSIPTNANNQDIVSMGTIAARKTKHLLDLLYQLLAIELMIMVQGVEIQMHEKKKSFSDSTIKLVNQLRNYSSSLIDDRPLSKEIMLVAEKLQFDNFEKWLIKEYFD